MKHGGDRASLGFAAGAGAVVAAFCAACFLVARREWFAFDDFAFLRYVQEAQPWVWLDPRAVMNERFWPLYRPLGMETFYYVGLQLFGLDAAGFSALALLVNLLTGLLVLRIARRLGFGWPAAAASAVLAVTRPPATYVLFDASSFQYTSAVFFYTLAVACFLEHLRSGGVRCQLVGCVALGLGLLCNEVVLTLPAVLVLAGLIAEDRSAPARAFWRIVPQLLVIAGYLFFRFALLAPMETPSAYSYEIGTHVPRNIGRQIVYAFGGAPALGLSAALAAGIVWAARCGEKKASRGPARLLELNLLCLGWMASVLLPFVALPAFQRRFSTALAVPVGLLLGSYLDLLWRVWGQRRGRAIEAAVVVLLAVALPCTTLRDRARNPAGAETKRLAELMSEYTHESRESTRFFLLYGVRGLANKRVVTLFDRRLYGGGFIRATYPDRRATMRLVDVSKPLPNLGRWGHCVYLTLDPRGRVALAEGALLERILPARLVGRCISRREGSNSQPRFLVDPG